MLIILIFVSCVFAIQERSFLEYEYWSNRKYNFENVVNAIVEEMQPVNRCLVYIADSYYNNVIDISKIKSLRHWSLYQLSIEKNEIFSPPRPRFLSILSESRKSGCNAYIILIEDGEKVTKLLQYVENEHLVDTHGYFLCMYDDRIFEPEMSYLWNRILNVIFLNKHNVTMYELDVSTTRDIFNIFTVYYPVEMDEYVLTRYLDTWEHGHFQIGGKHFFEKTLNLKQKRIRVALFEHIPAVTKDAINSYKNRSFTKEDKALGIEFELILYIAKALNFEPYFYKPENVDTEKWGRIENGSNYTGLLGEGIAGRAGFYIGDIHNTILHHHLLELSQPYNVECLTFLVPESLTDNSWKLLIIPFKLFTWIMVISTLILGSIIVHFFSLFYKKYISLQKSISINTKKTLAFTEKKNNNETNKSKNGDHLQQGIESLYLFTEAQNSFLYIYSMLLQVSLPLLPRAWAVRVFIGWWWLYSILITVAYRASMTASLANPIQRKTIDTIAELSKSFLSVGGWSEEMKVAFQAADDLNAQKIGSKFEVVQDETEAIARVSNGTFCYYDNIYFLQHAKVKRQVLEAELQKEAENHNQKAFVDRNLHVMKECIMNMPVSLGMDKNSPLKPQVDRLISHAVELGLIEKWLSDTMEWSKIAEKRNKNDAPKALVNFKKLQGALVALLMGYTLAFIALMAEIYHWRYIVLKNPAYDKYHLDTFYKNQSK